jgi:hypothetical protein
MKKGTTLIEILIVVTIAIIVFTMVFKFGFWGSFTAEEMFMPEQSKARYQREMVEELRRANDLKERENSERH